jgi:transcriptional regulator with XRE-family HTH domain
VSIEDVIRAEITRRGLTPTEIATGAELPFSTVSEFLRGIRVIGVDKASKLAAFLDMELSVSNIRRRTMASYEKTVQALEKSGHELDDASIGQVNQFADDVRFLDEQIGGWTDEDVQAARQYREDVEWLQENDTPFSNEDAHMAAEFRANIEWLSENGWSTWTEEDAEQVAALKANLELLAEWDEEATEERIEAVAQHVANLKKIRR